MPTDGTDNCQTEYYSFLLRVWQINQEGKAAWRATLEHIASGEKYVFYDIYELVSFIQRLPYQVSDLIQNKGGDL